MYLFVTHGSFYSSSSQLFSKEVARATNAEFVQHPSEYDNLYGTIFLIHHCRFRKMAITNPV
jgi:hypothetical protein